MTVGIVTGAAGLVGSATVEFFCDRGFDIVGIDNDMRRQFFGDEASTRWNRERIAQEYPSRYEHVDADIRDYPRMEDVFRRFGKSIDLVVHTAAQPSHDWAARDPQTDFTVNANGTLNLLEATRRYCTGGRRSSSPRRTRFTATRRTACP